MIDIALKNMWQRKTRTGLTVVAIAVCIMLFLVLSTATGTMDQMFADSSGQFAGQMFVKTPSAQAGTAPEFPPVSSSMTGEKANALMNVSGIDAARSAPLLLVQLQSSMFQNGPPQVIAVGIPEGKEKAYYGNAIFGNGTGSLTGKDQVVLGNYAAYTYYKANVGDRITIQNHNFTVVGIADYTGSIVTDGMVLIPLSVAQEVFNRPGVSTVLITAPSEDKAEAVASAVRNQFPDLQVMTQGDMDSTLDSMASMTHTFMGMINLTMLVVAGVVTLMVMFMSVSERTKEFGMLRAIGARRSRILALVLEESVIVCIVGSVLGILLSFLMMQVMFGGTLFSLETMGKAVIFMTVIGVIAGLIPAYRSAKIQPLEAIRYE